EARSLAYRRARPGHRPAGTALPAANRRGSGWFSGHFQNRGDPFGKARPPSLVVSIRDHRKSIDKLDEKIVRLLNERTRHVLEIGEMKLKTGEEVYAPHRELAVLQRVCSSNPGPLP